MKKTLILLFFILGFAGIALAEPQVVPYYSLNFMDGLIIPTKGEYVFAIDLVNDIGLIYKPNEKNSFIGFYELKYNGPGLRRVEGEKFTDRLMDHIIILRHHYALSEIYQLKSQVDYMSEYKRTGSNEVWGSGLYDFSRYGLSEGVQRKFSDELDATVSVGYHFLNFPNYTDLLTEFQQGTENQETSTGKQNQTIYQLTLESNYLANKFSIDYSMISYQKQKVISDSVQGDGSYYSATLQNDNVLTLNARHNRKLLENINFSPSMNFKIKTSNQNYQQFMDVTSTVPVRYVGAYYNYKQMSVALPFMLPAGPRWELSLTPEFEWLWYDSRPPRDLENNFTSGLQSNELQILNLAFTYKPNDVTRTSFFYVYQTQVSNMKFEKYLPYNYAGHFFGMNFNYVY